MRNMAMDKFENTTGSRDSLSPMSSYSIVTRILEFIGQLQLAKYVP